MAPTGKPETIAEYIAAFPDEVGVRLEQVRTIIRGVVPAEAEETISYAIPTFKLGGRYLVYFAGYKSHVSVYPIPEGTASFRKKIAPLVHGAGTVRFSNAEPLPVRLIEEIVGQLLKANRKKAEPK